jgi:hypothetical protein
MNKEVQWAKAVKKDDNLWHTTVSLKGSQDLICRGFGAATTTTTSTVHGVPSRLYSLSLLCFSIIPVLTAHCYCRHVEE